jgi:hypothetical protein
VGRGGVAARGKAASSHLALTGPIRVRVSFNKPGENATMIFKMLAFVAAAIPIFLFVRSMLLRRPTRIHEGYKEFKKAEQPCRLDLSVPHRMCRNLRRWQAGLGLALNAASRTDVFGRNSPALPL